MVTTTGQRTERATDAAWSLLIDRFVDVGQLIALFVDFPEVGIAAHDQEFIGFVLNRHPWPHGGNRQLFGRQRILEGLVVHFRVVFGMEGLDLVGGRNVEIAFVHDVEELQRLGRGKGPLNGKVVDLFQDRRGVVQIERITLNTIAQDLWVVDQIFPGEDHIIRRERLAIRPFRPFDQVHGQLQAIVTPFPALGEVGEGFEILISAPERAGLDQCLIVEGHRLDAKPTRGDTSAIVPASSRAGGEVAPDIAIDANAIGHTGLEDDLGFFGQAFGHWGQITGLDQRGYPFGFVVCGQRLILDDRTNRQLFNVCATQFQIRWRWIGDGISRHFAVSTGGGCCCFGWGLFGGSFFGWGFCGSSSFFCGCRFFGRGRGGLSTATGCHDQKQRNQREYR